jgi:hypothetical protein
MTAMDATVRIPLVPLIDRTSVGTIPSISRHNYALLGAAISTPTTTRSLRRRFNRENS